MLEWKNSSKEIKKVTHAHAMQVCNKAGNWSVTCRNSNREVNSGILHEMLQGKQPDCHANLQTVMQNL